MSWEIEAIKWANNWVGINWFIDWTIIFRATYLLYVVVAAVFLFYSFSFFAKASKDEDKKRSWLVIIHAMSAGILARFVFTEIIRFFYAKPRPFEVLDGLGLLVNHSGGGSFPSGHAAFSFAVAAAVYYYYPKTSILFFFAALNIGLARVATGLHWPTDILGGALVGIFSAWLVDFLLKKMQYK